MQVALKRYETENGEKHFEFYVENNPDALL